MTTADKIMYGIATVAVLVVLVIVAWVGYIVFLESPPQLPSPTNTPTSLPPIPTPKPTSTPCPTPTPRPPTPTPKPTPTSTPILAAKPAFEVEKVRYAWSIYGKTCVRAAVVIRNRETRTVWLSDITFTGYDVSGKVLEVLPAWWIVPRIIRPGEAAYANAEAMEDLGDLEPSRVGELKVNFDYVLTDEEPQLLTVENFSGEESFIGYDVLGEVVNTSGKSAGEIHVAVALYDKNDNLLDVLDTHLSTTLASGDRMGFRAGSSCGVSPEVWKQVKRFEGVAHNLKFQW